MGLDVVELAMDVEEHFGISVQDEEFQEIQTVGQLVTLVHGRIVEATQKTCHTLPAFFRIRRLTRDVTENHLLRIRPRQPIASVLNAHERRGLWDRLPDEIGITPPALRRSTVVRNVHLSAAACFVPFVLFSAYYRYQGMWPWAILTYVVATFGLWLFTIPNCTIPPRDWQTFGDVAVKLVGTQVATKHLGLTEFDDVFHELRPLIVDATGADLAEVTLTARFIEDLGLD